jgi:thiamine-monophosphate kinase
LKEFDLIANYFATGGHQRKDVLIGIGDDAAVTKVPQGQLLASTTDTLVEGVHFLPGTPPEYIAHKAVACNLSDLAAMGAEPAWINLSLSIPKTDELWLSAFSNKLHELSEYFSFQLIGGDTVQGPLSITITAQGFVPEDNALTRGGAKAGDLIMVTGTLGDAGAGLDILLDKISVDPEASNYLTLRHWCPTPRILAGTTLRRIASSCIDISDGLLQDLGHLVEKSGTGALIHLDKLPISEHLGKNIDDLSKALKYAATAGDDYELLFTVSEEQRVHIETSLASYNIDVTCIGKMTGATGKIDIRLDEKPFDISTLASEGFEHFSEN